MATGFIYGLAALVIYIMIHQRALARRVIDVVIVAVSMGVLLGPALEMVAFHGFACTLYQWVNQILVATSSTTLDNPVFTEYRDTFKCRTL